PLLVDTKPPFATHRKPPPAASAPATEDTRIVSGALAGSGKSAVPPLILATNCSPPPDTQTLSRASAVMSYANEAPPTVRTAWERRSMRETVRSPRLTTQSARE